MPCISLVIFLSNQSVEKVRHTRQNSACNEVICLFFFAEERQPAISAFPLPEHRHNYRCWKENISGKHCLFKNENWGNRIFQEWKLCWCWGRGNVGMTTKQEREEMLAWLPNKRERKCWHDYQTRERGNVGMTTKQEREEMLAWLPNKREHVH